MSQPEIRLQVLNDGLEFIVCLDSDDAPEFFEIASSRLESEARANAATRLRELADELETAPG